MRAGAGSRRQRSRGKTGCLSWHAESGQGIAIIYMGIESCRAHGIDPLSYLRDVLTRLPAATHWQIPELTRAAWATRSHSQLKAA